MTRRPTLTLAAGAALIVALPLLGAAQNFGDVPDARDLEARLTMDDVAFRARVDATVDDDMLELGRLVAMGGASQGGADMACISCHGAQGQGDGSGAFPRLAGQAGWYTYKQLVDYASGARPNEIMSGIAQRLTEAEMEAVAAYYAVIEAPYVDVPLRVDHGALQWGAQLGAIGSSERGIPACTNCHGAQGTGLPPSVPYLAGQYADYMTWQLELWRDGVRDNDAMNVMSSIARKMTDEDMRAVSEYYARVRPMTAAQAAPAAPAMLDTVRP
ncbi:MAG: c-type cytochrome [Shimia sp.]